VLTKRQLNAYESLELSRLVINQNKNLFDNWLHEDKLQCNEELGDLVKTMDTNMVLKIYIKARVTPKVVATFIKHREFDSSYQSSLLLIELPVDECEKGNRLRLLRQVLEHLMNEGSQA
jgi:hypothetical protein